MTICWCGAPASGLHAYFCPAGRNEPDLEYATKGTTARLVEAEAAIQRVRELHEKHDCGLHDHSYCGNDGICRWCLGDHPCATIRALDGDA